MLTRAESFPCPWCGEPNWLELDPEEAGQVLIQDCAVCCSPIELEVPANGGQPRVRREGE